MMNNHTIEPRFEYSTSLLSKKWSSKIIYLLLDGPLRTSEIQLKLEINGRMLSTRLKELEKQEIIHRKVYPEYPIRVQYCLTEKGEALRPVFEELKNWSDKWVEVSKSVV